MPKFKLWEEVAVGLSLVLFLAAMISLAVTLGDPIDLLIKHVQASVQASAKSQPLAALPHHELTFIKETKSGYVIGLPTKTITVTHEAAAIAYDSTIAKPFVRLGSWDTWPWVFITFKDKKARLEYFSEVP
jgi:hypothetical protein